MQKSDLDMVELKDQHLSFAGWTNHIEKPVPGSIAFLETAKHPVNVKVDRHVGQQQSENEGMNTGV